MPPVDEVGQAGGPPDRGAGLHHGEERDGAFLLRVPPDAAPPGGEAFPGGPFDCVHDPLRCGEPDGTGQESELADDDGYPPAPDEAFSGQDGFVRAGLLAGRGQLLPVIGAGIRIHHGGVGDGFYSPTMLVPVARNLRTWPPGILSIVGPNVFEPGHRQY